MKLGFSEGKSKLSTTGKNNEGGKKGKLETKKRKRGARIINCFSKLFERLRLKFKSNSGIAVKIVGKAQNIGRNILKPQ